MHESSANQVWKSLVFPADYKNPQPLEKYHLVVIGAGPAGLVTAIGAAGLGAKVALVEQHAMGGDCLNVGCVPSKALLHASREVKQGNMTAPEAFEHVRRVRAEIAEVDSVERFSNAGVDVFLGHAEFENESVLRVGDLTLKAKAFVVATGSSPLLPPIPGLAEANALTNETVFELDDAPARIAVLGGGPIGCEMAQAFTQLGSEVTLIEMADQLLARESADAADRVRAGLQASGVEIRTGTKVNKVSLSDGKHKITSDNGDFHADAVLAAFGRRPNVTKLGLDRAGVSVVDGRIETDRHYRTGNRRVWAIGDVSSVYQFTAFADAQARALIQNALFPGNSAADARLLPMCTYTTPELARIGLTPSEAKQRGTAIDCYRIEFSDLDRAITENNTAGFAEILTLKGKDSIIGATIVADRAGDLIGLISILMSQKIGLGDLKSTLFCYPTESEFLKKLSDQYNRTRLTPTVAGLMKKWLDWTL